MKKTRIRVAAAQLSAGTDVTANRDRCVAMVRQAAGAQPDLLVLPEFCNHLSWYDSQEHCYEVAVELDGEFLGVLADEARRAGTFLVVNCTVRRGGAAVTGTSVLIGRDGRRLATADKQVLMGHENDFLCRATESCPVVDSEIGRLAMYACMDGVICETPRSLALAGAQILCNSLNSFAYDEASLHIPVRAPENRVFVVAANKVGPLIPAALLGPVSAQTNIPVHHLYGAGESQIVAPDGTVLARASRDRADVVFADIEVGRADVKLRPDGTDVFASRRPELYGAIVASPSSPPAPERPASPAVEVAVVQPLTIGNAAIAEAVRAVAASSQAGVRLVVLPELFFAAGAVVADPVVGVTKSRAAIEALRAACGDRCHVATSVVMAVDGGYRHAAVLIGDRGVVLEQGQLHASARHPWSRLADRVVCAALPWGRVALVVGDDAIYPETFRLVALAGADAVAAPLHVQERWEVTTGLVERAAENRVNLVAATRPSDAGTSLIATLHSDFTLMTPWVDRQFDGTISEPVVVRAPSAGGVTRATIHPRSAANKVVSHRTDLLASRPWLLSGEIARRPSEVIRD